MPARLQTLGHLRLLDEGGNDIVFPEKALLILCYLRTRGLTDMPRADAAGLFWDDANPTAAFASLRQTVARVQKRQRELGRTYLAFTDAAIALGQEPVESDVDEAHADAGLDLWPVSSPRISSSISSPERGRLRTGSPCSAPAIWRCSDAPSSLSPHPRLRPGRPDRWPPCACWRPTPMTTRCAPR